MIMPIFTILFTFIALLFACILDKGIILAIGMIAGIIIDVIFWTILEITDDKPDSGFGIDWGA